MGKILWLFIVGFIFISIPCAAYSKEATPPKKTPELLSQGKKLYEQNCITCHGSKGDGKGQLGTALKPAPSDFTKPFKQWPLAKGNLNKVFEVIANGIPNSSMIKWDQLPEKDRWALTHYVVDFAFPKTPAKKK
jgi:high-affinity iron transporter